jgi:hypothetical protein
MSPRVHTLRCALALGLLCLGATSVHAEVVRFRYAPKDTNGNMALIPGPSGAPGERARWLGGPTEPFTRPIAPTHTVTFRHPASNQQVIVPFTFPDGTPRIENRADQITYNWSGYQVRARFLADGSVEVLYNSGVLRPISFQ